MKKSTALKDNDLTLEEFERVLTAIVSIGDIRERYIVMRRLFRRLLAALTADANYAFSGPYAQVVYVAQHQANGDLQRLNRLRLTFKNLRQQIDAHLRQSFERDYETLLFLLQLVRQDRQGIVSEPSASLQTFTGKAQRQMRASVVDFSDLSKVRVTLADENCEAVVDLSSFAYLKDLVSEGVQLNLIDSQTNDKGVLVPRIVVFEPDFLVDISSIASCFTSYADTHELFLINKLKPKQTTHQILMGNMAGHFLDKCLNAMRSGDLDKVDYNESAREFFKTNALALSVCRGIDAEWHREGRSQLQNVADALRTMQREGVLDVDKAMTEPSFISEALGIQGRMDLLQSDFALLVEQKSGKMNEFRHPTPVHREEHYVQVVLYQLLLSVNFGIDTSKTAQFLFYSKYAPQKGLVREGMSPSELTAQIFEIRNRIVFNELRYAHDGAFEDDLMHWTPDRFRQKSVSDNLWKPYIEPQIRDVLRPVQYATDESRAYFFAMLSFLQRESVLSRLGTGERDDRGFSNLWNLPAEARKTAGEMIDGLSIVTCFSSTNCPSDSVDVIVLRRGDLDDSTPNFRLGDIVILYDYAPNNEPDVRQTIEMRATIVRRNDFDDTPDDPNLLTLKLRAAQSRSFFDSKNATRLWAIDHDMLDSQNTNLMRQLMVFLRAPQHRQRLLLGRRRPRLSTEKRERRGDYGDMNELVDKWLAADDMFLLVGPPGTGKTSRGLVSILREELMKEGHNVLLMSYTNRAVDEICSKLEALGQSYIRVGSRFSCAKEYRHRLLSQMDFANIASIRRVIDEERVFVGTTSAFCANYELFGVKHFDLAIVDEASQILEPNIVGLFSTCMDGDAERLSIDRFVLIGDHKQLPAVVAQRPAESLVDNDQLRAICLTDCRRSFFERMIELLTKRDADSPFIYMLTFQGRMHPETADFCNRMFYDSRLAPVPLDHQKGALQFTFAPDADELTQRLATERLLFFDSYTDDDNRLDAKHIIDEKINRHEARIVARIVQQVYRLRSSQGDVSPQRTIGIVVPYRHQITAIRNLLISSIDISETERHFMSNITIDTVERFQGSERDVIVYGFTVKNHYQLKFLTDSQFIDSDGRLIDRKLNVALSRAREQLIVVGNSHVISQVPIFASLIDFIEARQK